MKKLLYVGNKLSSHGNTPTGIEILGPLLACEGMKMTYASSRKNKFLRLLEMLWRTLTHGNSSDYVLIDTYSTSNFWYAFAVSQLCRIMNVKYIPILHGGALPNRLASNPRLCRMIFRNAHRNIAPSGFLYEKFRAAGFSNTDFIPNPVEVDKFPFKSREVAETKLLWVRSFSPIYNPLMALKVLHLLKDEYPDAKLCMVGPDKTGMRNMIRETASNLGVEVRLTGRLDKKQWVEIASDYDIFINTSHIDNAPFSLIEAASLGLPVVSTNVGGISYIFEHRKSAMLVDDNDAKAMSDAIKILVENQNLRKEIVQNALEISREYHWDRIKSRWLQILT